MRSKEVKRKMSISEKQLAANRANALHSTGPRTDIGKAKSAMNGFTSSILGLTLIMTDEDRHAQHAFCDEYVADWNPQGAIERQAANTLAIDNWRLNRLKAVEENTYAWGHEIKPGTKVESEIPAIVNALTHANTWLTHADQLNKLSLCEARLSRIIAHNTKLLMERQAERRRNAAQPTHEPRPAAQPTQHFTAANGFASTIPQNPAEPVREVPRITRNAA
jgi:hypothetical protein